MTFIYPLLLGGMVSVGLPILLHLLMRQKPKHLMFPAFRFLQQRAKRNQRKIRLRHLLLLLLRMLLLALICFALARPRVFSTRTGGIVGPNQAVAAVLVVDTSKSMDYAAGGKSRLDDAKQRALELLDEFSETSRVAVVDTSDPNREWMSVGQAREKVRGLNTKAGSQAVTTALATAYALFDELDREQSQPEAEALPRAIYVLSDRTVASWDAGRVGDLITQRDRLPAPGAAGFYIDLGVEKPVDVAIMGVDMKPQSVPTNQDVVMKATVTAVGQDCDTEILFRIVGENAVERKPVKLAAGQAEVIEFRRKGLKPGQYQAEITLATADALLADNARFVTFDVRVARKVLIVADSVADDQDYARFVEAAILSYEEFDCDVKTPDKVTSADDLKPYRAAFLLSVRRPEALWPHLDAYVASGGHLLVMPGRDDLIHDEYVSPAAMQLLPARLEEKPVTVPGEKGAAWNFFKSKHPMLKKFVEWDQANVSFMKNPRTARRYWSMKPPFPKENVVVAYAVKDDPPAVLERVVDRKKGAGRVLLFTTSFDNRAPVEAPWNNYAETVDYSFLVPVVNEALKYCAGDLADVAYNFTSGQALAVPLPLDARFPEYQIAGPGLTGSDTKLPRGDTDAELRIRQTDHAGNYTVSGGGGTWGTRFSLNPPANEFQLDRISAEEVEKLFGPDSVVSAEQNQKITAVAGGRSRQPIELFAWLMVFFVLAVCVECYLANRFYKPDPAAEPGKAL